MPRLDRLAGAGRQASCRQSARRPAAFHHADRRRLPRRRSDNLLVVDTNKGRIIVELYPFAAPNHVAQIKALAKQHFYDGQTFFRVIEDFMDQTGDPTNKGDGQSKLPNIKAEFTFRRGADLPFVQVAKPEDGVVGFIYALPVTGQTDDLMAMTADNKVIAWPLFLLWSRGRGAQFRSGFGQ